MYFWVFTINFQARKVGPQADSGTGHGGLAQSTLLGVIVRGLERPAAQNKDLWLGQTSSLHAGCCPG